MNLEEAKTKINEDKDYIHIKRFDYSIERVIERYSEGAPTKVIAQALLMSEAEVEQLYQQILIKLREKIR